MVSAAASGAGSVGGRGLEEGEDIGGYFRLRIRPGAKKEPRWSSVLHGALAAGMPREEFPRG